MKRWRRSEVCDDSSAAIRGEMMKKKKRKKHVRLDVDDAVEAAVAG